MAKAFSAVKSDDDDIAPFDAAGWASRLTFRFALPLFRVGFERPLVEGDLPRLAERDRLPRQARRIGDAWARERRGASPSLARALARAFRRDLVVSGLLFLVDFGAVVTQAALLRPFVNWLARGGGAAAGAAWGGAVVAAALANMLAHHWCFYMLMRLGWNARLGLTVVLHDKLLRTRTSEVSAATTGRLVSLVTTDAQRFDNLGPFIHCLWASPVLLAYCLALLADVVGWAAAAAGCGVLVASVGLQAKLGFVFKRLRARTAARTDARVRTISEALTGILAVKAFAWEGSFLERILAVRAKEAASILSAQHCRAVTSGLYFCTVSVSAFATFLTFFYARRGDALNVGDVCAVIGLLNSLRQVISFGCAYFMMAAPECLVATRRMQAFLESLDVPPRPAVAAADGSLELDGCAFAWPGSEPAVRGATCSVAPGDVVGVGGAIGSGKSTLLAGVLGELAPAAGTAVAAKRVAYAPQTAWIVAGTLLENVTQTGPAEAYDAAAFARACDACALGPDLDGLPGRERAILGERGVLLSGGQKARVALARCVYAALVADGPTLCLLDDPLAAVDPNVAAHLLDKCVFGALRETCGVVLCSHSRLALSRCDRVLVLDADGGQLACAPPRLLAGDAARAVRGDGDDEGGGDAVVEAVEAAAVAVAVDAPAVAEAVDAAAVDAEDRETGGVAFGTWLAYARRAGALSVVAVLLLFVVGQALLVYSDYYLLEWANGDDQRKAKPMIAYGALAAATVVVALLRAVAFFCRTIIASNRLHEDAVRGVLRSPLYWHHAVPRGRVLNRLSADVGNVDELLAQALFDLAQLGLMMGARPGAVDLVLPPR